MAAEQWNERIAAQQREIAALCAQTRAMILRSLEICSTRMEETAHLRQHIVETHRIITASRRQIAEVSDRCL